MADDSRFAASDKHVNSSLQFPFTEIYFLGLASQSNIYCCVKLEKIASGLEKVLVGSLRGKVSCIDRSNSSHGLSTPTAKEVYFTYIPGNTKLLKRQGLVWLGVLFTPLEMAPLICYHN